MLQAVATLLKREKKMENEGRLYATMVAAFTTSSQRNATHSDFTTIAKSTYWKEAEELTDTAERLAAAANGAWTDNRSTTNDYGPSNVQASLKLTYLCVSALAEADESSSFLVGDISPPSS